MKKKKLPFVHNFTKLSGQKTAVLIDVVMRRTDQLNLEAVKLETEFSVKEQLPSNLGEESDCVMREKYGSIPKSSILILYFRGNKDIIFTDYRKYSSHSGRRFDEEIRRNRDDEEPTTIYEILVEDQDEEKKE